MEHRKAAPLALVVASALVATACLHVGSDDEHRSLRRPTSAQAPSRRLFDMAPPSHKEGYYQWMWADAKELGDHELAEADPFRWSDWLNAAGTIADLQAYQTTENMFRPVELMAGRDNDSPDALARPLKFGSIDEAIAYLSAQTTTQPPRVVEKTTRVTVAGGCPDASHLNAGEALFFMALGSALTLVSFALYCCCACTVRRLCCHHKGGDLLDASDSDEESKPTLALTDGRTPQPYQGVLQDSDLATLLADIEEEEQRLPAGPRSLGPASPTSSGALREEAAREVDRVLGAKGAREIFGNDGPVERRAQYRRLVRLLHPDKKAAEGQRASLALRRVVECYRSLSDVA